MKPRLKNHNDKVLTLQIFETVNKVNNVDNYYSVGPLQLSREDACTTFLNLQFLRSSYERIWFGSICAVLECCFTKQRAN